MKKKYVAVIVSFLMILMSFMGCIKDYTGNIEYECSVIYICGKPKEGWFIGKSDDHGIELREKNQVFAEIFFTENNSKSDDKKEDIYPYQSEKGVHMNIHFLDESHKNDVVAYANGIYQNDEYIQKIEIEGIEKGENPNYNEGGYNAIYYFEPKEKYATDQLTVLHYNKNKYSGRRSCLREDDALTELKSEIFLNGFDFNSAKDVVEKGILAIGGNYIYYEIE